jgi:hypothetical protein
MSVSSVRRRYLGLRTPTVRPMGTTTVTLRRWDMVLRASDLTTRDGFNWSDAHLSIFPILSRNPVIPIVLDYRIDDSIIVCLRLQSAAESRKRCISPTTSAGSRTRAASWARALLSGCREPGHNRSVRAAIHLRVRARREIP